MNVVDDGVFIVYNDVYEVLNEVIYVVFDVEMIGLFVVYDIIIEFVVVKMYKGNVIESFDEFIDLGYFLFWIMVDLIGIMDEMVWGLKLEEEVLWMFFEFLKGIILVVYNVVFDMGFLNISYVRYGIFEVINLVIDILELVRYLYL